MERREIRGAPASNAGDDFHIMWALHQALRVLDFKAVLTAVTVEGLSEDDRRGEDGGAWEGVDVGLYYGGRTIPTSTRVELAQLKYSTGNPTGTWTVARLTKSSTEKKKNSVIYRLAAAFAAAEERLTKDSPAEIVVKLVTNQAVHQQVLDAIAYGLTDVFKDENEQKGHWATLKSATALDNEQFRRFASALDLSAETGPSRFSLRERVTREVGQIVASDSRQAVLALRQMVFDKMLPESDGLPIEKETVLGALNLADEAALLPCPPHIAAVENPIPRQIAKVVARAMVDGRQRICLHGEGGCGKTTVLQQIVNDLPPESEMLVFDCYGGGTSGDSEGKRHLPQHAFQHMANELAARVGAPLFVPQSPMTDFPREFSQRLQTASALIGARSEEALLVVVIDAADNSVTAADEQQPAEPCFVPGFLSIGSLPPNVRLLVSCRTGRLSSLKLPGAFEKMQLTGFTGPETTAFVRRKWPEAPEAWIADMQQLSLGNARTLAYAFEFAGEHPERAKDFLFPSGKSLPQIFEARIAEAIKKTGKKLEFANFCAALIALPRPIPLKALSAVLALNEAHVHDLSVDLSPGTREENGAVGFADEDFEAFVRDYAVDSMQQVQEAAANYFLANHETDAYSAEGAAPALLKAGKRPDLLRLVQGHPVPKAIKDPVIRREVQLTRLRLAMKAAREAASTPDAVLVLLNGANALKTDAAVRKMITDNVDLAAKYAVPSLRRTLLFDREEVGKHGSVLSYLMFENAIAGNRNQFDAHRRQFDDWTSRRRKLSKHQLHQWPISTRDIAATVEAMARVHGAEAGIRDARRWSPKTVLARVALMVSHSLLVAGDAALLESAVALIFPWAQWKLFLQVPLALAGRPADETELARSLGAWVSRRWIDDSTIKKASHDREQAAVIESLLVAAEIVASRRGDLASVRPFLEIVTNEGRWQAGAMGSGDGVLLDWALRARSLLERADGRELNPRELLVDVKSDPPAGMKEEGWRKHQSEQKERTEKILRLIVPLYNARAAVLLTPNDDALRENLRAAAAKVGTDSYEYRNEYGIQEARRAIAVGLVHLSHLQPMRSAALLELILGVFVRRSPPLDIGIHQALRLLAAVPEARDSIITFCNRSGELVLTERMPAGEKADALLELSRTQALVSRADASSLYARATAVLEDIDYDSIFGLTVMRALVQRSWKEFSDDERTSVACQIADVSENVRHFLGGVENFPWDDVFQALTRLKPAVALAAVGRWGDADLTRVDSALQAITKEALAAQFFGKDDVFTLLPLVDYDDSELVDALVGTMDNRLRDEFARFEVLSTDRAALSLLLRAVSKVGAGPDPTPWVDTAKRIVRFVKEGRAHRARPHSPVPSGGEVVEMPKEEHQHHKLMSLMPGGESMTFTTAGEIQHVVNSISAKNRAEGDYLSSGQVFEEMRMRISLANRRAHLEALAACEFDTLEKYRQAEAITRCIKAWIADSLSVADWAEHELPEVVTKLLPYFAQSMDRWEWTLSHIIDVARLSDDVARDTIIRGLEMHASELNARTVYEVLVVLASRLTPADARKILEENLASLTRAIDPKQVRFYAPDIPSDTAAAIARLIFTMLGDLEMPARWQAAYCIRHAARCRNRKVLDALWDELNRKADNNFRIANAPYYWLASQLWMMIGLARAAHEAPDVLHHQVGKFVAIALNDEFPHLLIRHFAKQSIETLIATGGATLTDQERDSLEKVNAPQHFVLKETGNRNKSPPRNRGRGSDERRRFDFDSMDTLPYWYSGAVAPFADVDMREFIDLAECWIVDSWSNTDVKWAWKGEPRLARLENNGMASSHSHGSLPRLERFHTHLEWHAMWCAAGQLALSRPIVKRSDDEYDSWSSWYSSSTLTWPPFWLADFRQAKPLEMNLWFASEEEKDEEWLRGLDVESALKEIGLHLSRDEMVVDCEYSLAEHRC